MGFGHLQCPKRWTIGKPEWKHKWTKEGVISIHIHDSHYCSYDDEPLRTLVHSKKNDPWQPQLVGWYERRPLHGPNMVFSYWSKKNTTMFRRQNYRPVMALPGVVPNRCRLSTAVCGRSKYFFLVTEHFETMAVFYSGWSGPVDGYCFQKHQPSRPTTVTKRWRDVIWNPDVLLQIDKGEAHPKKARVLWQKKKNLGIFFYTSTSWIICCRPLCIAPVQLLC